VSACAVCGKPGELAPAINFNGEQESPPGVSCSKGCARLLFFRLPPGDDWQALERWLFRARRAESHGLPFDEPAPLFKSEREFETLRPRP
jgi:hypothetical protein